MRCARRRAAASSCRWSSASTASVTLENTIRKVPSANVAAKLEGADPKLKDEWLIYSTHWDHFGIGPAVNGDTIYRGAIDNASGTAGLLEIARGFDEGRAEAAPVDPLPLRHRRGAGAARLRLLRRAPAAIRWRRRSRS